MQHIALKALVLADCGYYGHCFDAGLSIPDLEAVVGREPGPSGHGVKCEDCLVQEHEFESLRRNVLELRPHAIEPVPEVWCLEVDLALCARNEFELDSVLLVEAVNSGSRDPHIGELPVEHLRTLLKGEVRLRDEGLLVDEVANVLMCELEATTWLDLHAKHR